MIAPLRRLPIVTALLYFLLAIGLTGMLLNGSGCGTTGAQIRKDIGVQCGMQNDAAYNAFKGIVTQLLTAPGQAFESVETALLMFAPLLTDGVPAVVCMVKVVIADLRAAPESDIRTFGGINPEAQGVAFGERFAARHANDK